MKKVILFARVSTLQQDLEPQVEAVKKAIIYDGYKPSEIVVVQGKESAIKLKEEERQTINEVKQLILNYPTIEAIYFFAVDRLARRMSVVMSVVEWATENKLNLVFLNPHRMSTFRVNEQGVKVEDELTTLLLAMLSYGASMEMKIKKARFTTAKRQMKAQGKATGSLVYGYTKDTDKSIVVDKEQSKIVLWAYDSLINKGMSCYKIYLEGLELGYFSKKTKKSGSSMVLSMLKNSTYYGNNANGVRYPSIVSRETYDKAVEILNGNLQKSKSVNKTIYYCKGIIRNTRDKMVLIPVRNNAVYRGNNYSISVNIADTIIWREAVQTKWSLLSNQKTQNLQSYKQQIEELKVKIWNNEDLVKKVENRMAKAYDGFINNDNVTDAMYKEQVKTLTKELNQYKQTINTYTNRIGELEVLINNAESKQARDISLTDVQAITDDVQRVEIINEVITNMMVEQIGDNEFYINVYNVINGDVPMSYYYKRSGYKQYLEMALDGDIRVDITEEIQHRLKPLRDVRKQTNNE